MTSHRSASLPRARALGPAGLPGVRTLRSARFRMVLAATLLVVAVSLLGLVLLRQAAAPDGQFAIDFAAYQRAAAHLAAGSSPYDPALLAGPVAAQGAGNYLYPPLLAQVLQPIATFPLGVAASLWLAAQAAAAFGALWLGLRFGRRPPDRPGLEAALWTGVAATWFLPLFDTLWKGNVSAFVALQVALIAAGGGLGGASLASAVLLKVSPIAFVPLALARDRRFLAAIGLAAAVLLGTSVVLAPSAWLDYARVLPNLFGGDATQANNLSPWAMSMTLGLPANLATLLRGVSLVAAALCALAAIPVARRPDGWHAAVVLGTVSMLLVPAQLWYHYLLVLLPLAAFAWGRATARQRGLLVASAAAISLGIAWLPLATLGAVALTGTLLLAFWPRGAATGPAAAPAAPAAHPA